MQRALSERNECICPFSQGLRASQKLNIQVALPFTMEGQFLSGLLTPCNRRLIELPSEAVRVA
jgi:hypothetical protein